MKIQHTHKYHNAVELKWQELKYSSWHRAKSYLSKVLLLWGMKKKAEIKLPINKSNLIFLIFHSSICTKLQCQCTIQAKNFTNSKKFPGIT